MTVTVRPLEPRDEAAWRRHWSAYLEFYETGLKAGDTEILFKRMIAGEPHFALVAEQDGAVIGFVHGLPHASTWSLPGYCYLEDLYVDPQARGAGAGRALIEAVAQEAKKRGLTRVYWHTDKGNETARALYDKLATLSDFVQYRL